VLWHAGNRSCCDGSDKIRLRPIAATRSGSGAMAVDFANVPISMEHALTRRWSQARFRAAAIKVATAMLWADLHP